MGSIGLGRRVAIVASTLFALLATMTYAVAGQEDASGTDAAQNASATESGAGESADQAAEIESILSQPSLLPLPDQPTVVQSDPEALKIIERYLEAVGGRETLLAIQDRVTKFDNTKYQATAQHVARIALYLKRGYLYREEWDIPDFSIGEHKLAFVQIYNGKLDEGWVSMLNTISPLEGRTLSIFVWDKHIDDFFVRFEKDGYTAHIQGKGIVDSKPATIVRVVDFTQRNEVRYFFDDESGLVVKKEWVDAALGDAAGKKEQYYKRYRRISFSDNSGRAVQFPLQVEIMVDGILDTDRIYTDVRFNSGLSDELFGEPDGVPFEERDRLSPADAQQATEAIEQLPIPGLRQGSGSATRSRHPPIRSGGASSSATSSDSTEKAEDSTAAEPKPEN